MDVDLSRHELEAATAYSLEQCHLSAHSGAERRSQSHTSDTAALFQCYWRHLHDIQCSIDDVLGLDNTTDMRDYAMEDPFSRVETAVLGDFQ